MDMGILLHTELAKKKEVHTVMTEKFTNNKKYSTDFVQLAVLKKERPYPH
jgi:hypothetical protein